MPKNKAATPPPIRRSTRSKRIRYTELFDDDESLESLLRDHERVGLEHRARRTQHEWTHPGYEIPLDSLPALCIERVLGFISNPRDLHSMSLTNKSMAGLISLPLVVRCGVFHSLRKKKEAIHRKTLGNIMGYVQNRSIHLPSPSRILRLLNATYCERGDECWGKNLCTGRAGLLDGSSYRPFGLAMCDKCLKYATIHIPYSHFSRHQNGVAFYQWNKLANSIVDSRGVRQGPLVRVMELQQIESSFDSAGERNVHLKSVVERAHEASDVCPLHYEENAATYVKMFREMEKEADRRLREEEDENARLYAERREEKHSRKVTRVRAIYELLSDYLGDCPLKELALECDWRDHDYQNCLKFKCFIVEDAMSHMISAPSSTSDRQIRDAATTIKQAFTALHEKDFFDYNFISGCSHKYKKGLHEYCKTEATPLTILSSTQADSMFISLVEQNQLLKALIRTFNYHRCPAMPRAFALAVVRTNPNAAESLEHIENYRTLAESVWKKKNLSYSNMTITAMKESYQTCLEEFKAVKRNAREYLAHEDTDAFLRRGDFDQVGEFTRQMAVNQVFKPSINEQYFMTVGRRLCAYDLLKQRNFSDLRVIHTAYFSRPSQYNLI